MRFLKVAVIAGVVLAVAVPGVLVIALTDNPLRREFAARSSTHTVESRLAEFAPRVEQRWKDRCLKHGVPYPPLSLTVAVHKRERTLRVFAPAADGHSVLLMTYPVLAASGGLGPKLKEGDLQVPEGVYRIESLNPNSRYHAALRINYPNDDDRAAAALDGRASDNLGSDIMIHGGNLSVGCVAIGDDAIEELFFLVAKAGIDRVELLLCPTLHPAGQITPTTPQWLVERYRTLTSRLRALGPR